MTTEQELREELSGKMPPRADLRSAAVDALNRDWGAAIVIGTMQAAVFKRLLDDQNNCHAQGLHTVIDFADDPLTQRAWEAYQEMNGTMIPARPGDPPPTMKGEDEIVEAVTT